VETTDGLFVYRTIDDLEKMILFAKKGSKETKNVAIVGGGLLGLEAAKAIADLDPNLRVSIVERNNQVCLYSSLGPLTYADVDPL